jgi:hypothetical protein
MSPRTGGAEAVGAAAGADRALHRHLRFVFVCRAYECSCPNRASVQEHREPVKVKGHVRCGSFAGAASLCWYRSSQADFRCWLCIDGLRLGMRKKVVENLTNTEPSRTQVRLVGITRSMSLWSCLCIRCKTSWAAPALLRATARCSCSLKTCAEWLQWRRK